MGDKADRNVVGPSIQRVPMRPGALGRAFQTNDASSEVRDHFIVIFAKFRIFYQAARRASFNLKPRAAQIKHSKFIRGLRTKSNIRVFTLFEM